MDHVLFVSFSSVSVTLSPHTLHQYRVSLEVYMRQYNSMQETLDTVHKALFQQKLSLLHKVRLYCVIEYQIFDYIFMLFNILHM